MIHDPALALHTVKQSQQEHRDIAVAHRLTRSDAAPAPGRTARPVACPGCAARPWRPSRCAATCPPRDRWHDRHRA